MHNLLGDRMLYWVEWNFLGKTLKIFGLYWAWFYFFFHALGNHFIYSSATVFLILNNHHVRVNYLSKCDKLWTLWIRTIIMFVIIMITMRTTQKIVYIPLFLRLPNNLSFYLHSTKEIDRKVLTIDKWMNPVPMFKS